MKWNFFDWMNVSPDVLGPGDAIALKVVAVVGYDNDFAVYAGPTNWTKERVAEEGDKLFDEETCKGMFPQIARTGRYVRT